ncbi:uncharacterized protein TNCV_3823061 [Trichonephila clavipes]|nr:uncharacterized protein TNCV_3823061 [Trichonephila clavipes]
MWSLFVKNSGTFRNYGEPVEIGNHLFGGSVNLNDITLGNVTFIRLFSPVFGKLAPTNLEGCGSPGVKASNHDRHVMSSSPVPLKTCRIGQRCTLNLSRTETSSQWRDVVVRRGVPAQVSSKSLDHGSKLRGPSPKPSCS